MLDVTDDLGMSIYEYEEFVDNEDNDDDTVDWRSSDRGSDSDDSSDDDEGE